ncbi:MAG: Maf family protein [Chloroflexota bacterium]
MTLILASTSPRRRVLLQELGLPFEVVASGVAEPPPAPGASPASYAQSLSLAKARAVARLHSGDTVLGADTVVAVDQHILGKPRDPDDALRMLRLLRGRWHEVITAVAAICGDDVHQSTGRASVHMRNSADAELAAYANSGEPMDKSGSYAVQGLGGALVDEVRGCFNAVVGLPLCSVADVLQQCGLRPDDVSCCDFKKA